MPRNKNSNRANTLRANSRTSRVQKQAPSRRPKRELQEEELAQKRWNAEILGYEKADEKKVRDAIAAYQKNHSVGQPFSLYDKEIPLFGSAYMVSFNTFETWNISKFVYFTDPEPTWKRKPGSATAESKLCAQISFGALGSWSTMPFQHPEPDQSGKATVVVKTEDGAHEMTFRFFGDECLEMEMNKNAILSLCEYTPRTPVHFLPTMFKFVGGENALKKNEAPNKAQAPNEVEASKKAEAPKEVEAPKNVVAPKNVETPKKANARPPRPPSPRDSWFESNHFMGAYYDSRYAEYY